MKRRQVFAVGLVVAVGVGAHAAGTPKPGVDWPQFRGIRAGGVAEGFPLAEAWDIPSGRGVRWKTAIPGLGLASPIVWGDLICLSTSISGQKDAGLKVGLYGDVRPVTDDTEHEWRIYCLDKKSGAVRWQQSVLKAVPKIKRHTKSSHANSTLATDGERLIAFFGSEGLYAYDLKGKQLWKKDLGVLDAGWFSDPTAQWETGSSPILHDNVVVVQVDVQKGSFLGAFDARDGRELWRTPRADVPTWGTPAVHQVNGQTQLIVNGWRHIGAYDFKTGKEIWRLTGGGDIPVPTPVVQDGLIYITNAHGPQAPVYAIRETATGDITLAAGTSSNQGDRLERAARWRLHVHAARLSGPRLHRQVQRRALRVRREDRREEIPAAACRGQVGVHVISGGVGWQGLSRQRGRPCLRDQGRPELRGDSRERHGRERAGDAGDLRGRTDLSHPGPRHRRRRRSQAVNA